MSPLLRKPDDSVVEVFRNPDGSWFEVPEVRPHAAIASGSKIVSPAGHSVAPESIRQFLREIGRRGGQARAARHNREELSAWGRVRNKTKSVV